jgi:hypothetical protein
VGVTAGGVHLPAHRVDGKRAREAGLARGFEALRVPDWDEDALTMAVEAGLQLPDEALAGVERVRLFLDEAIEQAGLAARALDVDAPVTQTRGRTGLVAELAAHEGGEELWLAAGSSIGGAGVAWRLAPADGVEVRGSVASRDRPLDPDPEAAVDRAVEKLAVRDELPRLAPPETAGVASQDPYGWQVGDAGPAAAGLELLAHHARASEPALLVAAGEGQAHAVHLGEGSIPVEGLGAPAVELDPEAYRQRQRADPPAWSEASQGAYVSREVYDHDPERRYGARARGGGEVAAVTTIEAGPPGEFERQHEAAGPYDVVIVSRDEGGREIGQAASGPGELSIGDRVRPVLRRVFSMEGQTRYGLKWRASP